MRPIEVSVELDGNRRDERGRLLARCRIPFAFNATMGLRRIVSGGEAQRAGGDAPDGGEQRAAADGDEVIEGPASSTSLDWYGTHMGRTALESMARQFVAGVDYLPRHHSWMSTIEWDGVIGRTFASRIASESVKEPVEGRENLVLYTSTRLKMRKPLAQELVTCIEDGDQIGQSIGGWFTEVAVIYDEDGWVKDVEVLDVELDHLAAVRSPACPDADRIWLAASRALVEAGGETVARASARITTRGRVEVETRGRTLTVRCAGTEEADEVAASRSAPAGEIPAKMREADPVPVPSPSPSPSEGEAAPPPAERSEQAQEEEMAMPMSKEELEQLAALFGGAVREAVKPLADKIDALGTRAEAPKPEKTPLELATERAERAEAELRAARARQTTETTIEASRTGQRSAETPAPGAAPVDLVNGLRGRVDGPNGVDLRTVCPKAIRFVRRSMGEVSLSPGVILAADGMRGVVAYAEAEGSAPSLVGICRNRPAIMSDRAGLKGAMALAHRYSPAGQEAARRTDETGSESAGWHDREDLRDLLSDVFEAALSDAPEWFPSR